MTSILYLCASQTLGMDQDLGASALVRRSIERGEGAGDNWEEYRHRLAQARSAVFLGS